jgi:hypothetical protein
MLVQRRFLAAACAAAVAAAGCLAADADASTISSTIPCVANLGFGGALTLPLAGSGFTPNGSVTIRTATRADPTPRDLTTLRADASGNIAVTRVDPPVLHSASTTRQAFTLLALDTANPANSATTTFTQVRFGFNAKPSTGRPTRRVTYTARGYLPGRPGLRPLPLQGHHPPRRARRRREVALRRRLQAHAPAADEDALRDLDGLHGPGPEVLEEDRAAGQGHAVHPAHAVVGRAESD